MNNFGEWLRAAIETVDASIPADVHKPHGGSQKRTPDATWKATLPVAVWRVAGSKGGMAHIRTQHGKVISADNPKLGVLVGLDLLKALDVCRENEWTVTMIGEEGVDV